MSIASFSLKVAETGGIQKMNNTTKYCACTKKAQDSGIPLDIKDRKTPPKIFSGGGVS